MGKKTCRIIFSLQRFNILHTETKQGGCKQSLVNFAGGFCFSYKISRTSIVCVVQWEGGVTRVGPGGAFGCPAGPIWAVLARERMKDEKSISAKKALLRLLEPDLNLDVALVQN